jgi:hypothetical protein
MPRPRQRVCLEQGLRLDINDINKLARLCFVRPGAKSGRNHIQWSQTYTGATIASGLITANFEGSDEGWVRIQIGNLDQRITLAVQPRHFGGSQWYFKCPHTHRHCSVLWRPPGARLFGSRQTWRRQVAYASQFATPLDRAHRGQAKIKSRLIGNRDPDEWDLPPKPKWMRWSKYNRYVQKFDSYEDILDRHTIEVAARLMSRV